MADLLDLYVKVIFDDSQFMTGIKSLTATATTAAKNAEQTITAATKSASGVSSSFSAVSDIGEDIAAQGREAAKAISTAGEAAADAADKAGESIRQTSNETSKKIKNDSDDSADEQQKNSDDTKKKSEKDQKDTQKAHENAAKKSTSAWQKAGKKIGVALKTAAKIGAAAFAAVGAATIAIVKQGVDAYSEYQQLAGGIDKIFGESSEKIKKYAEDAYKTSGMSRNEYMQNVTGFSAALINSLEGDTDKAAELADKAMEDISDNANTYGKYTVEELAQVYQALARGNYQTLDNLMLGFAGTKEGAQQLIEKAEKLDDAFKAQRDENGKLAMSYSDIINAIHIVQTDMNIAGTTSKEAAGTIQGSLGSLSAAWKNLVGALADPNADLSIYIDNVVQAAVGMSKNLLPTIEKALNGVGVLVEEMVPVILSKIPSILDEDLPVLLNSVISVIESIIQAITDNADKIASTAVMIVGKLSDMILKNLPILSAAAFEIIITLVNGITQMLPELIPAIVGMIETIISTLTDTDILEQLIEAAIKLAVALATGLANAAPKLIVAVKKLVDGIIELILSPEILSQFINAAVLIILAVASAIIQAAPDLLTAVFTVIGSIASAFLNADWEQSGKNVVNGIWEGLQKAWSDVETWWTKQWGDIIFALYNFATITIPDTFTKVINYLAEFKTKVSVKASEIVNNFKSYFEELPSKLWSIGTQIVDGLKNGITERWSNLTSTINDKVNNMVSGVKSALRIASPSKVFKEIGEFTAEGFDIGFEDKFNGVSNVINDDIKNVGQSAAGANGIGQNITVNFNIDKFVNNTDSDIYELADKLSYIFQMRINNERAVFA